MKYFWVVCEAMSDEPLEELGGRTPLEVAKKPAMDELAKISELGMAQWGTPSLPSTGEVAAFSMLGYDPRDLYTGLAPLEAAAAGFELKDSMVVFRSDFVTVSDGQFADPYAGFISDAEAALLFRDLKKALQDDRLRFERLGGYKNLAVVSDPQLADELDDLQCAEPERLRGERVSARMPKGKAAFEIEKWMAKSQAVLENHEVNRVRIDLGENPASALWFWAQGKTPKLKSFRELRGMRGACYAESGSWRGLSILAGLTLMKDLKAASFSDFNIFQISSPVQPKEDFKAKVRRIEEFDAKIVGPLWRELRALKEDYRLLVTTDALRPSSKGHNIHSPVPFLWYGGKNREGSGVAGFSEKNCASSGKTQDPGHAFIDVFLKN